MRVPISWLRAYCDPPLSTAELGELLTGAGIELGHIERVGVGSGEGFVVAHVVSAERHPEADRLSVCTVDDGSPDHRTIVCGAPNVRPGLTVAVARPGALMPSGERLGEPEIRGVRSSGMILAEDEVGIGPDHSGVIVLDDGIPVGAPLADHLLIGDEVLDLEVSPNRPDCLAVYGVAREVHALTGTPLADDPAAIDAQGAGTDRAEQHAGVEIEDPEICLRFTARVYSDVQVRSSPLWLKARLTAAGQRPISNVVDITNYVMLLTGQPLHAFDLERVAGRRLVIRRAHPGERLRTLDGVERSLDPDVALVCDEDGPSGIAGIMGGERSEVSDQTDQVLMEAATWVGTNIMRSSQRLAIRTEASARFEKQLHPDGALVAQRLAATLMVDLCGARLVPGTLDAYPAPKPARRLHLRPPQIARVLGEAVPADEVRSSLARLGFALEAADDALLVSVPSFRDGDVQREIDLIEEVARVHGVDRLPTTLPARRRAVGRASAAQRLRRRLEDQLRDRGLYEVVSYSFTSPEALSELRLSAEELLTLANPLSEEQSVMRPLLLPGLLDAARHNAAHGRGAVALFESAHVYLPAAQSAVPAEGVSPGGATPARERHHIAALITQAAPGSWRSRPRPADFYAIKALAEALLDAAGAVAEIRPGGPAHLHPGRSATLEAEGRELGHLGELHPSIARRWEVEEAACFELDADDLCALAPGPVAYRDLVSYPPAVQDIAVIVPEEVTAAEIEAAVRAGGAPLLDRLFPFDLYRGEQVGEGSKSLALRLEFRSPERTLTDEDVAGARARIESELARLGGRLRA